MLKKIGIIGGIGFPSTLLYYEQIHKAFEKEYEKSEGYPEVIIISLNFKKMINFMTTDNWDEYVKTMDDAINRLGKAGADFGAIACNTAHNIFDRVRETSPIPLLSIVEETFKYMKIKGYKKTLLLGTKFTMTFPFFRNVFKDEIKIEVPEPTDLEYVDKRLWEELEFGIVKEETRKKFIEIIEKVKKEKDIDSVILGCTEIPLLLTEKFYAGLEMINTTEVHVQSIIEYCRKKD